MNVSRRHPLPGQHNAVGKGPFTTGKEQRARMNHDRSSSLKKRLQEVLEYLVILEQSKFTGYIRINYSQGSVGRIEKMEEILPNSRAKGAQEAK